MERWQWRAEDLRMQPPPVSSWVLEICSSAKNKCLTLYLTWFGFSFQELVIYTPARLQSPSAHTDFSLGMYFYSRLPFLKHTELFESLQEQEFSPGFK